MVSFPFVIFYLLGNVLQIFVAKWMFFVLKQLASKSSLNYLLQSFSTFHLVFYILSSSSEIILYNHRSNIFLLGYTSVSAIFVYHLLVLARLWYLMMVWMREACVIHQVWISKFECLSWYHIVCALCIVQVILLSHLLVASSIVKRSGPIRCVV